MPSSGTLWRRSYDSFLEIRLKPIGALVVDRARREVLRDGVDCTLTAHQFELLWALASRAGRVLDRGQLSATLNNGVEDPMDRTIDVHIRKLREKLGEHYFKTVKGVGYKFVG